MNDALANMTLEELWALFPIELTEHRSVWAEHYAEMEAWLHQLLPAHNVIRISHIGSTAIHDIWAKPIVDILVEVTDDRDISLIAEMLVKDGFIRMSEAENRISLNHGYTENGFADKIYHIHVRSCGDNDELYFRDYLNDHPHEAKEYEKLKLSLWHRYEHDREGYTEAKGDFVKSVTTKAKALYDNRYSTD